MTTKKYEQWYKTVGLKHVTGFLTAAEKQKLKKFAAAADKSLSRYVTRLMQQHIREMEEAEMRRQLDERKRASGGKGTVDGKDGHGLLR